MRSSLDSLKDKNLIRKIYPVTRGENAFIKIAGKLLIDFTSNDYLGIARSSIIKKAFVRAIELYGFGSGASAVVSGYSYHHQKLEEKFAEFLNYEKAILFNSGYQANIGLFSTIANKNTQIILDKLCHASIIDGIKLSGSSFKRYVHNNFTMLSNLLAKSSKALVVSEGVFSMEGDITDIAKLAKLSKEYKAKLIIDDAHSVGVLGKTGKGSLELYNLSSKDVYASIVPLGKAFGGQGAIVAGSTELVDYLRQFSRSYIYSTSLPSSVAYTAIESLRFVEEESFRRNKLQELIYYFINLANQLGIKLLSEDSTPIKSIIIGCNKKLELVQRKLMASGFYIAIVRAPTVPHSLSRIKIVITYLHEEAQIKSLLELLSRELLDDRS